MSRSHDSYIISHIHILQIHKNLDFQHNTKILKKTQKHIKSMFQIYNLIKTINNHQTTFIF